MVELKFPSLIAVWSVGQFQIKKRKKVSKKQVGTKIPNRKSDIRNIPPIMEEEVANFCRPVNGLDPIPNLSDLYERIPEPMLIETSQTDEEFYKFRSSAKSKHRSLSLPPVRGHFILLNRMMNTSPLNKFRSGRVLTKLNRH
jgi:hypothetical protein